MYDKNLNHLADLSPYKFDSKFPFNQWTVSNLKTPLKLIIINQKSRNWISVDKINTFILDSIYQNEEHPVVVVDCDDPQVSAKMDILSSRVDEIYLLNANKEVCKKISELRKQNNICLNFFWFHANRSFGYILKYLGFDTFRTNDKFFVLTESDRKILNQMLPKNKAYVYGLKDLKVTMKAKRSKSEMVYIGRISESKNIHWILMAMAKHLEKYGEVPALNIYGEEDKLGRKLEGGLPVYSEVLNKLIDEFGLQEKVFFHGFMPKEKIYSSLPDNSFGIYLSTFEYENYGLAAREFLESGRPLIVSEWGGMKDIFDRVGDPRFVDKVTPFPNSIFDLNNLVEKINLKYELEFQEEKFEYREPKIVLSDVDKIGESLPIKSIMTLLLQPTSQKILTHHNFYTGKEFKLSDKDLRLSSMIKFRDGKFYDRLKSKYVSDFEKGEKEITCDQGEILKVSENCLKNLKEYFY